MAALAATTGQNAEVKIRTTGACVNKSDHRVNY
jgi:hypothetical protein